MDAGDDLAQRFSGLGLVPSARQQATLAGTTRAAAQPTRDRRSAAAEPHCPPAREGSVFEALGVADVAAALRWVEYSGSSELRDAFRKLWPGSKASFAAAYNTNKGNFYQFLTGSRGSPKSEAAVRCYLRSLVECERERQLAPPSPSPLSVSGAASPLAAREAANAQPRLAASQCAPAVRSVPLWPGTPCGSSLPLSEPAITKAASAPDEKPLESLCACCRAVVFVNSDNSASAVQQLEFTLPPACEIVRVVSMATTGREYPQCRDNHWLVQRHSLTNSKNAADVALAMMLGRLDHALPSSVAFFVLSKDSYRSELAALCQVSGRRCYAIDPHQVHAGLWFLLVLAGDAAVTAEELESLSQLASVASTLKQLREGKLPLDVLSRVLSAVPEESLQAAAKKLQFECWLGQLRALATQHAGNVENAESEAAAVWYPHNDQATL
eukprot:TRINITY_DN17193_c0_g1_i1.p1 TRINITY_DN17193_c0_g1~~TRINITY_DN17193_c0_g1_i1.p1  ORF type:complete len:450 (-),score=105.55 TRINITY_DN17193_c0_g1_i1:79-1401(-)